eukprot:3014445-Pleurochrysis_carterae.AAC.2
MFDVLASRNSLPSRDVGYRPGRRRGQRKALHHSGPLHHAAPDAWRARAILVAAVSQRNATARPHESPLKQGFDGFFTAVYSLLVTSEVLLQFEPFE